MLESGRPMALIATYIVGINTWNTCEDILVNKLDRHVSRSICSPIIDQSEERLNLIMCEDILCVGPIR